MVVSLPDKAFWAAWNRIPGLGARRFQQLLIRFGTAEAAWRATKGELQGVLGEDIGDKCVQWRKRIRPEREIEIVDQLGVKMLTWLDPGYPLLLKEIPDPPPVLYLLGNLEPRDFLAVAVVGTRKASRTGLAYAESISRGLAEAGLTVVSGLALGIDAVAHSATLQAGGRTLAVLGCGIDRAYPREHSRLKQQIAGSGAVLSPYAPGTPPYAANFPARNRVIAGLAWGTIVIEAGRTSGALVTAAFACQQNRDVCAVPGDQGSNEGCLRLISEGAVPVRSAQDVLKYLNLGRLISRRWRQADSSEAGSEPSDTRSGTGRSGISVQAALPFSAGKEPRNEPREENPVSGVKLRLLEELARGPATFDELLLSTSLPPGVLQQALLSLEMDEKVQRIEAGRYRRMGG